MILQYIFIYYNQDFDWVNHTFMLNILVCFDLTSQSCNFNGLFWIPVSSQVYKPQCCSKSACTSAHSYKKIHSANDSRPSVKCQLLLKHIYLMADGENTFFSTFSLYLIFQLSIDWMLLKLISAHAWNFDINFVHYLR